MNTISLHKTHDYVRRGFSLIEVMIAITIGTLIIGAAMYSAIAYLDSAKRSSTRTNLQNVQQLIQIYHNETGEYPETLQDLKNAVLRKNQDVPKDAWGRSFVYHLTPDAENPYELFSYGREGKGGDKKERISLWKLKGK